MADMADMLREIQEQVDAAPSFTEQWDPPPGTYECVLWDWTEGAKMSETDNREWPWYRVTFKFVSPKEHGLDRTQFTRFFNSSPESKGRVFRFKELEALGAVATGGTMPLPDLVRAMKALCDGRETTVTVVTKLRGEYTNYIYRAAR